MLDPVTQAALGTAFDAADKVGLLRKLWAKLVGDPNTAAQHLGVALFEVRRTLGALRDTLFEISYLGVEGQDPVDVRRALDRIEAGELYEEVIRAKGSCHKIGNIYDQHLATWFGSLGLETATQDQLRLLFNDLRDSDGWAVDAMERFLNAIKPIAPGIRRLLETHQTAAARKEIEAAVGTFRPRLEALSETMAFMIGLEGEFMRRGRLTSR
jgi:hypothetical protein